MRVSGRGASAKAAEGGGGDSRAARRGRRVPNEMTVGAGKMPFCGAGKKLRYVLELRFGRKWPRGIGASELKLPSNMERTLVAT